MRHPYGGRALITGASSGIGAAAARLFADAGYTVYAASRHPLPDAERITGLPMDVTDDESVRRAVARMAGDGGVGVVLHCAGMGVAGAAEDTPDQDVRDQFEVNYFGVLRVNRHVVPLLRQAGQGLVIITGSVAGRIPIPYQSHYSATKYALDAYAECLRMELKPFGVKVTLIEPGDTATGFTAARRFAVPEGSPYAAQVKSAVARMERDERSGHPAAKPARAALRTASRKNPPPRVTVGASYRAIMALRRALPARALEAVLSRLYR